MKIEEEKELKEKRGEIITHFACLEFLIKRYISFFYFKTEDHPIVSEIFEDEYFNFGLLSKIFDKILLKEKIKFPGDKLRRLGQLRNIVAHAQVKGYATGLSREEVFVMYFRHGGEDKEIESIFKEYDQIKIEIDAKLKEILKPDIKIKKLPEHKGEPIVQ